MLSLISFVPVTVLAVFAVVAMLCIVDVTVRVMRNVVSTFAGNAGELAVESAR